jgi:Ca-activated chloride channel family protein
VSAWVSQLHWREPLWLLLILLPLLMLMRRKRSGDTGKLQGFADPPLLQRLLSGEAQRPFRSYALIAAWTLAALAAAGPYWQPKDAATSEQRGADIAVIVDISPSMGAADITPTRLGRAKRELRDFTAMLGGDRLALVAFSANAYTMLPLTTDQDAFLHFVDLLDPTLTALPGSNLARALEVAQGLLSASAQNSRTIVLLSDGEYHDPDTLAAARHLNADHIPLFVIGVGTTGGGPVPNADGHFMQYQGQVVISHLDRGGLQALAKAGQGAYFDLSDDDRDWHAVISQLRSRTRAAAHASSMPLLQGVALYPWLLAASLILFLWSGARRRERLALLLLPLLLPSILLWPTPGEAAPWTEQRAYEALQQGDYDQAQRLYDGVNSYSGQLGEGAAAYHRQDWQTALNAFKHAAQLAGDDEQKAHALYNTANALAQLHRFEGASSAYRKALDLQPNLSQAALNLSLVNQFLDAHRGEQQRKDSKQLALPNVGATPNDSEQFDQQGRGDQGSPQAARGTPSPNHAAHPAQAGSQAGQQAGGTTPPPHDNQEQRLQQTLALWRTSAAHGSGSPQLEAMQDNSAEFLRRRFRQDDYGPNVMIIEGKPW